MFFDSRRDTRAPSRQALPALVGARAHVTLRLREFFRRACRRKNDLFLFAASEPRTLRGIIDKLKDCYFPGSPFFCIKLWILHNSTIISRRVRFCTAVPLTGILFRESFARKVIVSVFTIRRVFKNVQFLYITPY